MKKLTFFILLSLLSTGCIKQKNHQGNVIDPDSIWIIQEGDTRFSVESEMGAPAIKDKAKPRRSLYIEDFYDEGTGEKFTRGVEIIYDKSWRVKHIRRFGFE